MAKDKPPGESHERMLQFFEPLEGHLELVRRIRALAYDIADSVPRSPERTVALRKLLEARDAVLRAHNVAEVP